MSGLRGSLLITCLSKIYVIIVGQVKTALWGSFLQRVSADALQARQGRQAAITVSARMERFLCAWRRKTARGVLKAMQTTRGPSRLNVPVIKQSRMQ